jgi:hypothetical protein
MLYNLIPYGAVIPYRTDGRSAEAAYWAPALDFLRTHPAGPEYRVEVVPTGDHWESYRLPREGVPLARGWYRQIDIAQNPLFYRDELRPAEYRSWLRSRGVRYVLLPDTQLGRMGEEREAELLRSGRSGLVLALRDSRFEIYELPRPTPILTGPAQASLVRLDHERIAGRVAAPGTYRLAARFTPLWRLAEGRGCLARAPDGMTSVRLERAGPFELALEKNPFGIVEARLDGGAAPCDAAPRR